MSFTAGDLEYLCFVNKAVWYWHHARMELTSPVLDVVIRPSASGQSVAHFS